MQSKMKHLKRRILSDSAWAFGAKIGTGLGQIVIGVLLARLLSPETFGEFQVLQRFLGLGAVIGAAGLGWVSVRFVAEAVAENRLGSIVGIVKKIFFCVSITSFSIGVAFFLFGNLIVESYFDFSIKGFVPVALALTMVFMAMQQIFPELFRGLHDIKYASLFSGLATNTLLTVLLGLSFFYIGDLNLENVIYLFCFCSLCVFLFSFLALKKHLPEREDKQENDSAVNYMGLYKIGFPLLGSSMLLFIVNQSNVWIAASFFGVEVAAFFAAAVRLIFIITVPLMIANSVIKPMVSFYWVKSDVQSLERLLRGSANITLLISLLLGVVFFVWSEQILGLLFGDFYRQGGSVLRILAASHIIIVAMGPCAVLLALTGQQKVIFNSSLVGVAVFLICNFSLIPFWGVEGIAVSVALSRVINQGILTWHALRVLKIKTYFGGRLRL